MAVILYHFRVTPFSGGFIGVDIFFVISGYLITGILFKESINGVFSLYTFYSRRARRLLPALIATVLLAFITGYFILFPEDLARQSRETIAALLGASNILFWTESGYFDSDALLKPLLHTWSLSVEFQFYAFWPFLIGFLAKTKRVAWVVLAIAALASLLACVHVLFVDAAAGFFLTPFRIWEFAIGGLVFFIERRRLQNRLLLDALYLIGFGLNVACMVAYNKDTLFPGWAAIPPVFATALMIYAGPGARLAALFTHWPTRFTGQISYSLYLVHWPILVFSSYLLGSDITPDQTLSLIGMTFIIAVAMFSLVESPFRNARSISPLAFNLASAGALACLMVPAVYGWMDNGLWAWQLVGSDVVKAINTYDLNAARDYVWSRYEKFEQPQNFQTTKPHVLLIGDSQSADLLNMFVEAGLNEKVEIITRKVFYECGLPYLPEGEREKFLSDNNPISKKSPAMIDYCNSAMNQLIASEALKNADVVLVAFLWQDFAKSFIKKSLGYISAQTKGKMWIVGSKTFSVSSARMVNDLGTLAGIGHHAASSIPQTTKNLNQFLEETYAPRFLNMLDPICPARDYCLVVTQELKPIFWDSTHFTKEGAVFIWNRGANHLFDFLDKERPLNGEAHS